MYNDALIETIINYNISLFLNYKRIFTFVKIFNSAKKQNISIFVLIYLIAFGKARALIFKRDVSARVCGFFKI